MYLLGIKTSSFKSAIFIVIFLFWRNLTIIRITNFLRHFNIKYLLLHSIAQLKNFLITATCEHVKFKMKITWSCSSILQFFINIKCHYLSFVNASLIIRQMTITREFRKLWQSSLKWNHILFKIILDFI